MRSCWWAAGRFTLLGCQIWSSQADTGSGWGPSVRTLLASAELAGCCQRLWKRWSQHRTLEGANASTGLGGGIWASGKSVVPLAVDYPAVGITRRMRHAGLARKDMKP